MTRMITAGDNEKESEWLSQDLTELCHDDVTHQLEAILGKDDANQFLKPTIQDKPQKVVDQNITKRAGQIGARNLWNSLRTHSQKKLLRNAKTYDDDTYSKYNKDQTSNILNKIEKYKQEVELMYHIAHLNENKALHLLNNIRLPRIMDDGNRIQRPSHYYHKEMLQENRRIPDNVKTQLSLDHPNYEKNDLQKIEFENKERQTIDKINVKNEDKVIKYLSEEQCKTGGKFRDRMKALGVDSNTGITKIDHTYQGNHRETQNVTMQDFNLKSKSVKLPRKTEKKRVLGKSCSWQPLTINALAEYTQVIPLPGNGMFRNGRIETWKTSTS